MQRSCLHALRTQFMEFLASKRVNETDILNQVAQQDFEGLHAMLNLVVLDVRYSRNLDTLEAVISVKMQVSRYSVNPVSRQWMTACCIKKQFDSAWKIQQGIQQIKRLQLRCIGKRKEIAVAKPHRVNAPNTLRNGHKESYGSNDMVHAYFLEDARKMTQDKTRIPNHRDMASIETLHS
ncbi:hypothetical protein Tco_0695335 [Tanacetum coccineum]